MPLDHHRVLVVEDNPGDAELAAERLSEAPGCHFETRCAGSLGAALQAIATKAPEAVILDLNLPDSSGLETLRRVREAAPGTPVIVVSGVVDERLREQALLEGAEDVLSKDETTGRLFCRSVQCVIERQRAHVQHRQLEQLLDTTPDAMLAINAGGEVRFVNLAALTLLGRTREELMKERLAFAVTDGDTLEVTLPRNGDPRVCEMRVVGMEWKGESTHLASIRDITERQQAEALRRRSVELELQNERIRQASELKSAFVANMSHEIRTPMNAVIGLTRLLGRTRLDPDQRAMLAQLQVASDALMALLNNVLDLSKIEAGEVALEDLPFELPALVQAVAQMLDAQAQDKCLALEVQVAPGTPRWMRGDPMRLRQILTNLLGNAIKFTERGSVTLAVAPLAEDPSRLRFTVRDTGIGIDAAVQERLFTPFTQADASTTRRFGGTGLGLSIVRHLAELMGGRVAVQSSPGVGSEFIVEMPVGHPADGDAAAPGVALLCVGCHEGSPLVSVAAELGWQLETLPDRSAAGLRQRLQRLPLPDALIVEPLSAPWVRRTMADLRASGTDGATPLPPCLPLEDGRGAAHLFNEVVAALHALGRDGESVLAGTRIDLATLRWLPGMRLLVVDDSDINREIARRLLEGAGAEVETCGDAASALRRLDQVPEGFDAVLMDVQMPLMDGNEATRRLRRDPRLARLPVIALTAGALVVERQRVLEAGMNDFVPKPIDPVTLVRVVRRHVERSRGAPVPVEPGQAAPAAAGAVEWPHVEGIDGRVVAERLDGDVGLFATLLAGLLGEFAALGPDVDGALADPTARPALRARLHKLRGSAGMLGAGPLQQRAAEAELALAADQGGGSARTTGDAQGAARADGRSAMGATDLETPLRRVLAALAQLERHARPLIDAEAAVDDHPPPADAPALQAEGVLRLVELLVAQDMAALEHFELLSSGLRGALGRERFGDLRAAVRGLNFRRAADLVGPVLH